VAQETRRAGLTVSLPFYPGAAYVADARAATLAMACEGALRRRAARPDGRRPPLLPWETVVDEFEPRGSATDATALSWTKSPASCANQVVLASRVHRGESVLELGDKHYARARPRRRGEGGGDPARAADATTSARLLEWLCGRLLPGEAAQQGPGFVLDPIVWWTLAKLHYGPPARGGEGASRTLCVTRMFFPLSRRCWLNETPRQQKQRTHLYQSHFKSSSVRRAWESFLVAADNTLASEEGRKGVVLRWNELLLNRSPGHAEGAGAALICLVDEAVTRFVRLCAGEYLGPLGPRVQQQVENLQKVLFSFQGFVPLLPALWDPAGIASVKDRGVVPQSLHFKHHFPVAYLGQSLPSAAAEASYGDAVRAQRMSLLHILQQPLPAGAAGVAKPTETDTKRMLCLRRAVTALNRAMDPSSEVANAECSRRPETARAMLFLSADEPVPHMLLPAAERTLDARVLERERFAVTEIECGAQGAPASGPRSHLESLFTDDAQSETSE
jgi:hypothetical protein